jgi:hypothetical protein
MVDSTRDAGSELVAAWTPPDPAEVARWQRRAEEAAEEAARLIGKLQEADIVDAYGNFFVSVPAKAHLQSLIARLAAIPAENRIKAVEDMAKAWAEAVEHDNEQQKKTAKAKARTESRHRIIPKIKTAIRVLKGERDVTGVLKEDKKLYPEIFSHMAIAEIARAYETKLVTPPPAPTEEGAPSPEELARRYAEYLNNPEFALQVAGAVAQLVPIIPRDARERRAREIAGEWIANPTAPWEPHDKPDIFAEQIVVRLLRGYEDAVNQEASRLLNAHLSAHPTILQDTVTRIHQKPREERRGTLQTEVRTLAESIARTPYQEALARQMAEQVTAAYILQHGSFEGNEPPPGNPEVRPVPGIGGPAPAQEGERSGQRNSSTATAGTAIWYVLDDVEVNQVVGALHEKGREASWPKVVELVNRMAARQPQDIRAQAIAATLERIGKVYDRKYPSPPRGEATPLKVIYPDREPPPATPVVFLHRDGAPASRNTAILLSDLSGTQPARSAKPEGTPPLLHGAERDAALAAMIEALIGQLAGMDMTGQSSLARWQAIEAYIRGNIPGSQIDQLLAMARAAFAQRNWVVSGGPVHAPRLAPELQDRGTAGVRPEVVMNFGPRPALKEQEKARKEAIAQFKQVEKLFAAKAAPAENDPHARALHGMVSQLYVAGGWSANSEQLFDVSLMTGAERASIDLSQLKAWAMQLADAVPNKAELLRWISNAMQMKEIENRLRQDSALAIGAFRAAHAAFEAGAANPSLGTGNLVPSLIEMGQARLGYTSVYYSPDQHGNPPMPVGNPPSPALSLIIGTQMAGTTPKRVRDMLEKWDPAALQAAAPVLDETITFAASQRQAHIDRLSRLDQAWGEEEKRFAEIQRKEARRQARWQKLTFIPRYMFQAPDPDAKARQNEIIDRYLEAHPGMLQRLYAKYQERRQKQMVPEEAPTPNSEETARLLHHLQQQYLRMRLALRQVSAIREIVAQKENPLEPLPAYVSPILPGKGNLAPPGTLHPRYFQSLLNNLVLAGNGPRKDRREDIAIAFSMERAGIDVNELGRLMALLPESPAATEVQERFEQARLALESRASFAVLTRQVMADLKTAHAAAATEQRPDIRMNDMLDNLLEFGRLAQSQGYVERAIMPGPTPPPYLSLALGLRLTNFRPEEIEGYIQKWAPELAEKWASLLEAARRAEENEEARYKIDQHVVRLDRSEQQVQQENSHFEPWNLKAVQILEMNLRSAANSEALRSGISWNAMVARLQDAEWLKAPVPPLSRVENQEGEKSALSRNEIDRFYFELTFTYGIKGPKKVQQKIEKMAKQMSANVEDIPGHIRELTEGLAAWQKQWKEARAAEQVEKRAAEQEALHAGFSSWPDIRAAQIEAFLRANPQYLGGKLAARIQSMTNDSNDWLAGFYQRLVADPQERAAQIEASANLSGLWGPERAALIRGRHEGFDRWQEERQRQAARAEYAAFLPALWDMVDARDGKVAEAGATERVAAVAHVDAPPARKPLFGPASGVTQPREPKAAPPSRGSFFEPPESQPGELRTASRVAGPYTELAFTTNGTLVATGRPVFFADADDGSGDALWRPGVPVTGSFTGMITQQDAVVEDGKGASPAATAAKEESETVKSLRAELATANAKLAEATARLEAFIAAGREVGEDVVASAAALGGEPSLVARAQAVRVTYQKKIADQLAGKREKAGAHRIFPVRNRRATKVRRPPAPVDDFDKG